MANPVRAGAGWTVTHNAVVAGSTVEFVMPEGCNALVLVHVMTAPTTGGFATVENRWVAGTAGVVHHGKGTNIKAAALATNYSSLFEGVADIVGVVLARTDGTHTVRVLPIRV